MPTKSGATPQTQQAVDTAEMDRRIRFHARDQIMEVDFSGFHFDSSRVVNAFYDRLEERIAQTGEELWFFLVNLSGTRIDPDAWMAYSRRGKALNLAHSMGSVRFDANPETAAQIRRDAASGHFNPNLFADRESAIARLRSLPSKRPAAPVLRKPSIRREEIARRVRFDPERLILDIDLSNLTFQHSGDVDVLYDYLEERITESNRRWFFLVNLNGCQILPAAWVRYAHRGKRLNQAGSLGSVRYAAGSETAEEIRMRAESGGFRPNIRNTRDEALDLIESMHRQLLHGG
ncbi:MAG: hypothetical protein Kow0058_13850 [Roseovarius sp.]